MGTYKKKSVTYTKKKVQNKGRAIAKLDNKINKIEKKISGGMLKPFRFELQLARGTLGRGWNRQILIAPSQLYATGTGAAWKTVFNADATGLELYKTPKAHIKGIKLIQNFRLLPPASPVTINADTRPVVIHNYVVKVKRSTAAEWFKTDSGAWTANHLTQDVHYCVLGGDAAANIASNGMCFFMNNKCFNILAEHHFTFAIRPQPIGTIGEGQTNPTMTTNMKNLNRTTSDWIPSGATIKVAGNTDLVNQGFNEGWTGIPYDEIPPTDQILVLTYCTQGGGVSEYNVEYAGSGLIYGRC